MTVHGTTTADPTNYDQAVLSTWRHPVPSTWREPPEKVPSTWRATVAGRAQENPVRKEANGGVVCTFRLTSGRASSKAEGPRPTLTPGALSPVSATRTSQGPPPHRCRLPHPEAVGPRDERRDASADRSLQPAKSNSSQ